jgi:hypothetical protein
MAAKIFPRFDEYQDFTIYKMSTDGDDDRAAATEHIDYVGARSFSAQNTEWNQHYRSDANAERLVGWCNTRGIPTTRHNLDIGFGDLKNDRLLEIVPTPIPEIDNSRGVIQQVGDALLEYQTPDSEQVTLAKLRDDSTLNDHQRKARDRKLCILAGQQRREFAEPRRPDDRDPQIVI